MRGDRWLAVEVPLDEDMEVVDGGIDPMECFHGPPLYLFFLYSKWRGEKMRALLI